MTSIFSKKALCVAATLAFACSTPAALSQAGGSGWALIAYKDKTGDMTLNYPKGWKGTQDPISKSLNVLFTGTNTSGQIGNLRILKIQPVTPGAKLQKLVDSFEAKNLNTLKSYKLLSSHRVSVGPDQVPGIVRDCSFVMDGKDGRQSTGYFIQGNQMWCLLLNSPAWSQSDIDSLFDDVLASVKVFD